MPLQLGTGPVGHQSSLLLVDLELSGIIEPLHNLHVVLSLPNHSLAKEHNSQLENTILIFWVFNPKSIASPCLGCM